MFNARCEWIDSVTIGISITVLTALKKKTPIRKYTQLAHIHIGM